MLGRSVLNSFPGMVVPDFWSPSRGLGRFILRDYPTWRSSPWKPTLYHACELA